MPLPFIIAGVGAAVSAIGTAAAAVGTAAVAAAPYVGATVAAGVALGVAHDMGKDEGHEQGYKEGYAAASKEYEAKYSKLVDDFINDKKKLEDNIEEYKQLCAELLEKCKEYESLGYANLAKRAKNDYNRLKNAA